MTKAEKPFSPACERNSEPIYRVLKNYLQGTKELLEVGSGTGQHAVYFAQRFPGITWITTDRAQYHQGIKQWIDESKLSNLMGPCNFEVGLDQFPDLEFQAIFSANTLHIMPWTKGEKLIKMAGERLSKGSHFIIYGPFNENGTYTSEGNRNFDHLLRQSDPLQGIRDLQDITNEFERAGFELLDKVQMPANNQTLIFKKYR